ncbi:MAG: hypothetical protein CMJ23_04430 [Phycisphaerae bacterium]|nr:hypothetical protein [Phycisphaerae bacterium]
MRSGRWWLGVSLFGCLAMSGLAVIVIGVIIDDPEILVFGLLGLVPGAAVVLALILADPPSGLDEAVRPCPRCKQSIPRGATVCGECGRALMGIDPLSRFAARSMVGATEDRPCPDCGRAFRLERFTTRKSVLPGQTRCTRCGAISHGKERGDEPVTPVEGQ